jgi:hypothetical protein
MEDASKIKIKINQTDEIDVFAPFIRYNLSNLKKISH